MISSDNPTPSAYYSEAREEESSHFIYRKGSGLEKTRFDAHSLLTLNLCMMNDTIPALYGGMTAPAEERAKKAAAFVSSHNPDIFLAQEVTLQSSQALLEDLKDLYPHFWTGIGLEPGVKEADLFVASKYPIVSKPIFVPFPETMQDEYKYPGNLNKLYGPRLIERGFFAIETPTHWIVTTHLEPGNIHKGLPFRKIQLAYMAEKMKEIAKDKTYILAGDINVARTDDENNEYLLSGIPDLFYDYYTENHPAFDDSTFTCTNLFTIWVNGKPEPLIESDRNEIDDYVLVPKQDKDRFKIDVILLKETYDLSKDPKESFTDHRAYLAHYEISKS